MRRITPILFARNNSTTDAEFSLLCRRRLLLFLLFLLFRCLLFFRFRLLRFWSRPRFRRRRRPLRLRPLGCRRSLRPRSRGRGCGIIVRLALQVDDRSVPAVESDESAPDDFVQDDWPAGSVPADCSAALTAGDHSVPAAQSDELAPDGFAQDDWPGGLADRR